MVFFLVTRDGRHVLDKYLASWGGEFFDAVRVLPYPALPARRRFAPGTYVFADLERLGPRGRRTAGEVWRRLASEGERHRLLNHPERSLRRHALLSALHARGLNDFAAYRVAGGVARAWSGAGRFPVFLRRESDHAGPRTPLLWSAGEVEGVLAGLRGQGVDLSDWLVVEYTDCSDDAGYYRKYSSFVMDGVVIPRHVFFSRHWVQKLADLRGGPWAEEERAYVEQAPHADALRAIFALAGIQYGRIDYAIGKRGIQVWEINTNPIILDPFDLRDPLRLPIHEIFAERWGDALRALCARTPTPAAGGWPAPRLVDRAHVARERLKETATGRWLRRVKRRLSPGPFASGLP